MGKEQQDTKDINTPIVQEAQKIRFSSVINITSSNILLLTAYKYLFQRKEQSTHRQTRSITVDHLVTQSETILPHNYMRRHNEVLQSIHLQLSNNYGHRITR